jgi:WD40 repeat protein
VAVSGDSRWVVTGSWDNTAKIWDAGSGHCLQTLAVGRPISHVAFDTSGQFVASNIGPLYVRVLSSSPTAVATPAVVGTHTHDIGLCSDRRWITVASENVVWLTSDHRPSQSAVQGKLLTGGVGSGKVWICSIV